AAHQAPALQGEDGAEAVVKPAAFKHGGEEQVRHDEFLQVVRVAQVHIGAHGGIQPAVGQLDFAVDLGHHPVAVVDFALVQIEGFDAVLVGPGVQGFFVYLAGLVDLQFRGAHFFHHGQADVAHGQDVRGGQVGQYVFVHVLLRRGQAVVVVVDVLGHVDVQRGPVVFVGVHEVFPGPGVLEGCQLVDVGFAVDDAFVVYVHRRRAGAGRRLVFGFWFVVPI